MADTFEKLDCPSAIIKNPLKFLWRVVVAFRANQGLILSGAVAYYTLLSIIPIFTLMLIGLSHVVDDAELMHILETNLNLIVPGLTDTLLIQASTFLEYRSAVSWIGILLMLFFSSLAFTVLENTISVIFYHRVAIKRRHFMISAIIPYAYIMLVAIGFFMITLVSGALHTVEDQQIKLFFWTWELDGITEFILYVIGELGMIILLTSFYLIMPTGKISFKHALIGGTAATILWEISRHILIWYFGTLSMVNVIYGSLATAIVALLSLEIAGMILLFGAQLVAEYERLCGGGDYTDPLDGLETQTAHPIGRTNNDPH
ncbi:MAG: YihY/virulence factor BrkB family protein [Desulfobacterales bacterium]|nr:YihY/virulence factor BrkB family protein [Desulfobacterales bacterium]